MIEQQNPEIARLRAENAELVVELDDVRAAARRERGTHLVELDDVRAENRTLRANFAECDKQREDKDVLHTAIANVNNALRLCRQQRDELCKSLKDLTEENEELIDELDKARDDFSALQGMHDNLQDDHSTLEAAFKALLNRFDDLTLESI
jgi:chromosome segregation ATPase